MAVTGASPMPPNRLERRKAQTRAALISAAQSFIAAGNPNVPPRALRDIQAGVKTGRFTVRDPEVTMTIIAGASLCLGQFLHDHPERDDAEATDQVTEDLLRLLGLSARQAQRIIGLPLPDTGAAPARVAAGL